MRAPAGSGRFGGRERSVLAAGRRVGAGCCLGRGRLRCGLGARLRLGRRTRPADRGRRRDGGRPGSRTGRLVAARLVVLSGCETGVNEYRAGDEPVGLTRALLLGGSRTVIAGQWRVADGSAAALCSVFHRRLAAGHGSADALHRAARAVAGSGPGRRHFYHWGAFIAVGDWR
nr:MULTISPECIES: CHAT domain-containing protein [Streptomyces]